MERRTSLLFVCLNFLLLCSCAASNKTAANPPKTGASAQIPLTGTEWVLTDLAGTPALPGGKATLAFPEAGRVAGSASCNRFTGSLTITGEHLKMGPLASTRMACMDDAVNQQETTYFKALDAANRYSYQNPYLLIYADGFDKPLRFTRASGNQP
jgi:heat shock protein HslJ